MQIKYRIGVELSVYDRETKAGRWQFPKPEEGYVSNGYYCRPAVDENGNKIEHLRIKRYKSSNGDKPTISLLPDVLIPYQRYSAPTISQILLFWRIKKLSIKETIDKICKIFGQKMSDAKTTILDSLGGAQLYSFQKTFEEALIKYGVWRETPRTYGLEKFIIACSRDNYQRTSTLSMNYFQDCAGRFLFGIPSQLRSKPH